MISSLPATTALSSSLELMRPPTHFVASVAVCDDLQWADYSALSLIVDVLASLGTENDSHGTIGRRFILFSLYRDDEVRNPFSDHYSYVLDRCDVTAIHVSSLAREAVADMLMGELRLPRRFVLELADVVWKKTSGHAFFVVELLVRGPSRAGWIARATTRRRKEPPEIEFSRGAGALQSMLARVLSVSCRAGVSYCLRL